MLKTINLKFEGLPKNIVVGSTECNENEITIRFVDTNAHPLVNIKDQFGNNLVHLKHDSSLYWIGPYQILVPFGIKRVVAADGINSFDINGRESELYVENPISKEEYLERYTRRITINNVEYFVYKNH